MAENETLDLGDKRNRRWRHLRDGVMSGAAPEEIADRAASCVESVMKRILRYDPIRGGPEYPLADLLNAMGEGCTEVDRVLDRCNGHQYAHLLAEESAEGGSEAILSRHFERVISNFMDQIGVDATPERFASFREFQEFRQEVEARARPRLHALAKQIAANPTKPPRRAPQSKAAKEQTTVTILRESLLPSAVVRP